jgi:hypothetical protein
VVAEYTSAAISHTLVLWLIQAGAPPDLIADGLRIVADELEHARLSHEVLAAAGGAATPAIDPAALELPRRDARLHVDLLHADVRFFCLGETVAVPLFRHLRAHATVTVARAALDRILRDEVRHRAFGWDLLDWLLLSPIGDEVAPRLTAALPTMFAELDGAYGAGNRAVAADLGAMLDADRAWGLAPPREYAAILAATHAREYAPRFAARGVEVAWPPA